MKQTKELGELAGTGGDGEDGIDDSQPMLTRIKLNANYYCSTSI
jgi:hypothetical protein